MDGWPVQGVTLKVLRRRNSWGSPYGFELVENCLICKLRSDSFFCGLPKAALEAFDKIKYTASYPAGAVLFVEGQSAAWNLHAL